MKRIINYFIVFVLVTIAFISGSTIARADEKKEQDQIQEQVKEYTIKTNKYTTAKQIKDFIKENEIQIEKLDNKVKVSFKFSTDDILSQFVSELPFNLPKINGSMEIEENTGNVLYYEYNFKDYLQAILERNGEGKADYKANVVDFNVQGRLFNSPLDSIKKQDYYKDYSNNKTDFLKQISKNIFSFDITEG